jgi:hypothetical protein
LYLFYCDLCLFHSKTHQNQKQLLSKQKFIVTIVLNAGLFQNDFRFNKGIKLVKIDAKAMTITVTYNLGKIKLNEIRKIIAAYGYDADDVKADVTAYEKLDWCCKKAE